MLRLVSTTQIELEHSQIEIGDVKAHGAIAGRTEFANSLPSSRGAHGVRNRRSDS